MDSSSSPQGIRSIFWYSIDRKCESATKRKYVQIDYEKRKELIQVINTEQLTIKSAAEKLHINYPTAKSIVKLYRRESRIEKLPKRPNLTIKKITTPLITNDQELLHAALSPFYNMEEAQRILTKIRKPDKKCCTQQDGSIKNAQKNTSAQNCIEFVILT